VSGLTWDAPYHPHSQAAREPYAVVRHPMYAYVLPFAVGTSLMLGSLWGLLGFIPMLALLAARTLGEEAVMREGLAGYGAYAQKVRYRLVPGVW
jgi:protein-S-isoprenylcysteine O-methyltransferase Ste14